MLKTCYFFQKGHFKGSAKKEKMDKSIRDLKVTLWALEVQCSWKLNWPEIYEQEEKEQLAIWKVELLMEQSGNWGNKKSSKI